MTQPLLIEIGVEELPAIPLLKIVSAIKKSWSEILQSYQLTNDFEFIYTPRRLVLRHDAMPLKQKDSVVEFFGPPVSASIKDGVPTRAGEGFARKCGVSFESLSKAEKNNKEVLYFKKEEAGQKSALLLQEMLEKWIASMRFGKMMRWGSRSDEFIRPIRWLQIQMDNETVEVELFGVKSNNRTFLHRMVCYESVEVKSMKAYESILKEGGVMLSPKKRKESILLEFERLEKEHDIVIERDEALLNEVVAITENPKALLGHFDALFLELPPEVIITSMKEHQRYFPVFEKGKIANKFIVVSNAYTEDYSKVIAGNERVLKPRLADALFFYQNDLKNGLSTKGLEKVQFIDGLGTLEDKIAREKSIASKLLSFYHSKIGEKTATELEHLMDKTILLAKADLMSEMVYEFTELQGLMGYYYAKALGEDELIYHAIKEQYMPLGEGAELPSSIFSSIVSMSIKLDTLLGLFSVGKIPTGSKDPFALRRAVNGIIRMVVEYDLAFDIDAILEMLKEEYEDFDTSLLGDFILERIYKTFDVNPSVIASVLASNERDINQIAKKVDALNSIVLKPQFKEQFSTFKRVANISKALNFSDILTVDKRLFKEISETELYEAFLEVSDKSYETYIEELESLFGLKEMLDSYFENVMVNSEDEVLKGNRLNMIGRIYQQFLKIADIKEISI